jgi:hypothetical protein
MFEVKNSNNARGSGVLDFGAFAVIVVNQKFRLLRGLEKYFYCRAKISNSKFILTQEATCNEVLKRYSRV